MYEQPLEISKPIYSSHLIAILALAGVLSLFDQKADLLLPTTLFKGTFAKSEVNIQHTSEILQFAEHGLKSMDESPGFKSNSIFLFNMQIIYLYNDDHMVQNAIIWN